MNADEMRQRTKQFALRTLKLCRALPRSLEADIVRRQMIRCSTSVGANYRAAQRARSKAEFRAKLGIVLEEADETCFWLELVIEDGMMARRRVDPLLQESNEIVAIIAAALRSSLRQ